MIIGISGKAGSGKDSVANEIVKFGNVELLDISDTGKRFLMTVFGFSEAQLWGDLKEKEDERYKLSGKILASALREHTAAFYRGTSDHHMVRFLTPRLAMQSILEGIRELDGNVWLNLVLKDATLVLDQRGLCYSRVAGVVPSLSNEYRAKAAVICGLRSSHDLKEMKRLGHAVVRVKRQKQMLVGAMSKHSSEVSQDDLSDSFFDYVIENDGTLEELESKVASMYESMMRFEQ